MMDYVSDVAEYVGMGMIATGGAVVFMFFWLFVMELITPNGGMLEPWLGD